MSQLDLISCLTYNDPHVLEETKGSIINHTVVEYNLYNFF